MQNKFIYYFISFAVLFLTACSSHGVKPIKYDTAAYIFLEDATQPHRVYVNHKDIQRVLHEGQNEIALYEGSTNIQIVKKYKTANIDFLVQKGHKYYFTIREDYDGSLILLQTDYK